MMKISVLTPSYNSGKYIDRAIQSVIKQNYPNFEHIVTDGCSNDGTLSILKQYSHLKWVSEPDKGQSDAMNKAFGMCTGDIVVYLNADDEFADNAFEQAVKVFEAQPETDMVVGNLIFSDPKGISVRSPSSKYLDIVCYWLNLFPNNPVSYFYKARVQNYTGNFPIENHFSMDVWFLLKAYKKFKVIKIDTVLGTFHSDGHNKTALTDTGANLHNAVKAHLWKDNPLLLPYFYFKLLQGRFK
jgi:glycosyltransferase involved in cell wall biosynthesis